MRLFSYCKRAANLGPRVLAAKEKRQKNQAESARINKSGEDPPVECRDHGEVRTTIPTSWACGPGAGLNTLKKRTYLAVPDVSCGAWDPQFLLRHAGSSVVECDI